MKFAKCLLSTLLLTFILSFPTAHAEINCNQQFNFLESVQYSKNVDDDKDKTEEKHDNLDKQQTVDAKSFNIIFNKDFNNTNSYTIAFQTINDTIVDDQVELRVDMYKVYKLKIHKQAMNEKLSTYQTDFLSQQIIDDINNARFLVMFAIECQLKEGNGYKCKELRLKVPYINELRQIISAIQCYPIREINVKFTGSSSDIGATQIRKFLPKTLSLGQIFFGYTVIDVLDDGSIVLDRNGETVRIWGS